MYLRAAELGLDRVAATSRQRRAERHAVDHRAGIRLRPADPSAQHRKHVAAPARLGHRTAAGVEPAPADRCRAALARRILRRQLPAGQALPAHRQRLGSMLRYIDTTPLSEQLDPRDRGAAPGRGNGPGSQRRSTSSALPSSRRSRRRWRPTSTPRCAATAVSNADHGESSHQAPRICQELSQKDTGIAPEAGGSHEQIEVFAVADGPRPKLRRVPDEHDSLVASLSSFSDPMWQVRDRSVAGLRIAASGGIGQTLALGTLVAVRQSDLSDWVLGVVRRLSKVSTEEVEAGMSIIADRVISVTLHAVRQAKDDMGFIVDGIDISTMGARFHGLYLPPPSRRTSALGEDADHSHAGIQRRPQRHPDHRAFRLHSRAQASGGAARRVELVRDPDRREEVPRLARWIPAQAISCRRRFRRTSQPRLQ